MIMQNCRSKFSDQSIIMQLQRAGAPEPQGAVLLKMATPVLFEQREQLTSAVARALIWRGGGGIFIYSCSA